MHELKPKHAELFFVHVQGTSVLNAQQKKGNCMHCDKSVASTGANKFQNHLTSCFLCPIEVKKAFEAIRSSTEKVAVAKRHLAALAQEESQLEAQTHEMQQSMLKQQKITVGLKTVQVAAADNAIAEFFFANAIPFNAAGDAGGNELYRKMVQTIQNAPAGYVPPDRKKLAGRLLEEAYVRMWQKLEARDPGGPNPNPDPNPNPNP